MGGHPVKPTYSPITLWFSGVKPAVETVFCETFYTFKIEKAWANKLWRTGHKWPVELFNAACQILGQNCLNCSRDHKF